MDKLIVFSFFLPIFLTLPIFYQFLPHKTTNKKIEPKSNKQKRSSPNQSKKRAHQPSG